MMIASSMLAGSSNPIKSFDSHTKIRLCIPYHLNMPYFVSIYLLQKSSLIHQGNDMDEIIKAYRDSGIHYIKVPICLILFLLYEWLGNMFSERDNIVLLYESDWMLISQTISIQSISIWIWCFQSILWIQSISICIFYTRTIWN